jgi:hypothetical protein
MKQIRSSMMEIKFCRLNTFCAVNAVSSGSGPSAMRIIVDNSAGGTITA